MLGKHTVPESHPQPFCRPSDTPMCIKCDSSWQPRRFWWGRTGSGWGTETCKLAGGPRNGSPGRRIVGKTPRPHRARLVHIAAVPLLHGPQVCVFLLQVVLQLFDPPGCWGNRRSLSSKPHSGSPQAWLLQSTAYCCCPRVAPAPRCILVSSAAPDPPPAASAWGMEGGRDLGLTKVWLPFIRSPFIHS
jgi:hypothetical protein